MKLLLALLLAAQLFDGAAARGIRKTWQLCWDSCFNCLSSVPFADINETNELQKACLSKASLASHYLCLDLNCDEGDRILALEEHNSTCHESFGKYIPPFSLVSNYSTDDIAQMRRIENGETLEGQKFTTPILPSAYFFKIWFDTLEGYSVSQYWTILYGHVMILFWAAVVFLGILNRVHLGLMRYRGLRKASRLISATRAPQSWFKKTIVFPATFGYRCAQSVWGSTIPPRIQSLTIAAFLALNILFNVCGFQIMAKDNLYFGSPFRQITRYMSDRTGTISFINFPILWLFGMRNNIAMWLTGWDFATYSNFHRWVARIATIEAIAHTIGYLVLVLENGGIPYLLTYFEQWYWNAGWVAMIAMGLLLPLSIYWLRRRHYDTFLIVHIVLSILTLGFMLGHVSIFSGEYDILFWVPVLIWLGDRVARLARIVDFGRWSLSISSSLEYDTAANVLKLAVPLHGKLLQKPKAGMYYYLMVLDDKRWWQSHPFTIASIESFGRDGTDADERALLIPRQESQDGAPGEKSSPHMTFLIRPYNAFTARLKDLALRDRPLSVIAEGPYGHSRPLNTYANVLFIAGGTGVVGPLSYLPLLFADGSAVQNVEMHWAVRELGLCQTVVKDYLEVDGVAEQMTIDVYTSRRGDQGSTPPLPENIARHYSRPNVASIVAMAASKAAGSDLAVLACGPEGMLDDARRAVVTALGNTATHIDYFQENFAW